MKSRETIYGFDGVNNYRVSTTRSRIYRGKCIIDNRDRATSNRGRPAAPRVRVIVRSSIRRWISSQCPLYVRGRAVCSLAGHGDL